MVVRAPAFLWKNNIDYMPIDYSARTGARRGRPLLLEGRRVDGPPPAPSPPLLAFFVFETPPSPEEFFAPPPRFWLACSTPVGFLRLTSAAGAALASGGGGPVGLDCHTVGVSVV